MDESTESELRELEAKCGITKNELAAERVKLQEKKQEILSAALHYEEMEKRLESLYDADEKARDRLLRFKLRNYLV